MESDSDPELCRPATPDGSVSPLSATPGYLEGDLQVVFTVAKMSGENCQVEYNYKHGEDVWSMGNLFSQVKRSMPGMKSGRRAGLCLKLVCGSMVWELNDTWLGHPLAYAGIRQYLHLNELIPYGENPVHIELVAVYDQVEQEHV